ncbi:MAG: hypothetical protein Q8N17_02050 [Burkholderiaceae bacterium]|nr:hypothetical protein [Burkholderiaceae bacterium]
MKSIWIYSTADGERSASRPMPLPFRRMERPIDPEIFRRQARGEDVGRPRLTPSSGLAAQHLAAGHDTGWQPAAARSLCMVVSGTVEIDTGDGARQVLQRGDVFLEDDPSGRGHRLHCPSDCRLLRLGVGADWNPTGAPLPAQDNPHDDMPRPTRLRRMYKAADGKAYFREFDTLFPAMGAAATAVRPVRGFHFVIFPDGYFIDWHPEGCNNFVWITAGELALEVSGDRTVERFGVGDVCLAEDRTGEGHIDRAHGLVRMVLVEMEDEQLWPVAHAQSTGASA